MFCPDCGANSPCENEKPPRFCSQCGKPLQQEESQVPADYSAMTRYDLLIQIPLVRELIAAQAAQATPGLSSEDFLKGCEKVMGGLLGGVSVSQVAAVAIPISARLGIRTGKSRGIRHPQPIGLTIVAVLCSLARNSQRVRNVQQHEDGCTIEAVIPSDPRSFAGELMIDIRRAGDQSEVQAEAVIRGQLFDWGKCRGCLNTLARDLQAMTSIPTP